MKLLRRISSVTLASGEMAKVRKVGEGELVIEEPPEERVRNGWGFGVEV